MAKSDIRDVLKYVGFAVCSEQKMGDFGGLETTENGSNMGGYGQI